MDNKANRDRLTQSFDYNEAEVARSRAASEAWEQIYKAVPGVRGALEQCDQKHGPPHAPRDMDAKSAARSNSAELSKRYPVSAPLGGIPIALGQLDGAPPIIAPPGFEQLAAPDGVQGSNWVGWHFPETTVGHDTLGGNATKAFMAVEFKWQFSPPAPGVYHIYRNSPDPLLSFNSWLSQSWPHQWCNVHLQIGWTYGTRNTGTGEIAEVGNYKRILAEGKRDAWTHDGPAIGYESYPLFLPDWTEALDLGPGVEALYNAAVLVWWECGSGGDVSWSLPSLVIDQSADQLLMAVPW